MSRFLLWSTRSLKEGVICEPPPTPGKPFDPLTIPNPRQAIFQIVTTKVGGFFSGEYVTELVDVQHEGAVGGRAVVGIIRWGTEAIEVGEQGGLVKNLKRRKDGFVDAAFSSDRIWTWRNRQFLCERDSKAATWIISPYTSPAAPPLPRLLTLIPFEPHVFRDSIPPHLVVNPELMQNGEDLVFLMLVVIWTEVRAEERRRRNQRNNMNNVNNMNNTNNVNSINNMNNMASAGGFR